MTTETSPYGVVSRVGAYDKLGTDVRGVVEPREVLIKAGLAGWNVRTSQVQTTLLQDDGVETVDVPGKYAVVRTNPGTGRIEPLGGVRSGIYTPFQNEQLEDLLSAVIDQSGARATVAGQMNGGNRVFVAMQIPTDFLVGGVDPIDTKIIAYNSHDGSSSVSICCTRERIFCGNQQRAILRGAPSVYRIHHRSQAKHRAAEVRLALGMSFKYVDEFNAAAQRMIEAQLTTDTFREIVQGLVGAADAGRNEIAGVQLNRWKIVDSMTSLFEESANMSNIRGTAWAGYQAVTEYYDHAAPVTGRRDEEEVRATRSASGQLDSIKSQAFARMLATV